jgi:regulator of sigma E protease
MNIMLAVALLTGVYMMHYEYPAVLDEPAVIGWVNPDSPAERGGIKVGDKIVQVEDIQNPTWEQVTIKEALSPNQPLKYEIEHDGKITAKTLVPEPEGRNQLGTMGWVPKDSNVILTLVEPGMPAEKAGIKVGDQVLTANGQPIPVVQALIQMLKRTKDQPLDLAVLRNGQKLNFTVQPTFDQGASGQEPAYRIGIASASTKKVVQLNFTDALKRSLSENKNSSFLILELLQKMVQRKVSMRQVDGPIGIGSAVGEAAREKGWTPLLGITAAISLNLGIMNLLPIPILDGGVILLLFIESLMQKEISLPIKERIYQAAFVFLVLFAVMVIYNDLVKTLPGLTRMP